MENLHSKVNQKLDYFINNKRIPHIIFHGPPGSGKKTIVKNFINKIYNNDTNTMKNFVLFVNCSHGKGIKFIRDELKFFSKTNMATPIFYCRNRISIQISIRTENCRLF